MDDIFTLFFVLSNRKSDPRHGLSSLAQSLHFATQTILWLVTNEAKVQVLRL